MIVLFFPLTILCNCFVKVQPYNNIDITIVIGEGGFPYSQLPISTSPCLFCVYLNIQFS